MDSQVASIEEKLVPFVEGALAEADRREVIQALSRQPALNQEIRLLREAILMLRTQTARGMTYHSSVEAPAEQVVDFALDSEQWTRQSSRQFQLHILDSASVAEELSILKELEQTLHQHVEISTSVLEMPVGLRAAIQEAYGKSAAEPVWRRSLAAVVGWMAGMNFKFAAVAMTGGLVIFGAVSAGRYAHHQIESSTTASVALATPVAAATDALNPSLAAPSGQVSLLKEMVQPGDLPRLSRRLSTKQVSYTYRDGRIYVAQVDYEKASSALQIDTPEDIGLAKPLKTGPAIDGQKTNLRDGVIGTLPDVGPTQRGNKEQSRLKPAHSSIYRKPEMTPALAPLPVVAVNLPAAPEVSSGGSKADANYNVAEGDQRPNVKPSSDPTLHSAKGSRASAMQFKARAEARRDPVTASPKDQLAMDEATDNESVAPVLLPMQPPTRAAQNAVGGSLDSRTRDTEVKDPFEVAMVALAKKLVEELVGESKVQMERKEDGHLLVTIRPARSLSSEEVDKLRKVVREKLELKDEDTVVIRQP